MRVGILGGSFDPIHNGHLIIAQLAREQLSLDLVRLVVAGNQPFKTAGHHASAADRLSMVERAVAAVTGLVADGREVERAGPSWTVDTLREMSSEPGIELFLLMGADTAAGFGAWRDPAAIRRIARVAVFRRGAQPPPEGFDDLVLVPELDLSSTAVRARAAAGLSLSGWVPDGVADYISGLRLYGSGTG